jgi:hypothetical protein
VGSSPRQLLQSPVLHHYRKQFSRGVDANKVYHLRRKCLTPFCSLPIPTWPLCWENGGRIE